MGLTQSLVLLAGDFSFFLFPFQVGKCSPSSPTDLLAHLHSPVETVGKQVAKLTQRKPQILLITQIYTR